MRKTFPLVILLISVMVICGACSKTESAEAYQKISGVEPIKVMNITSPEAAGQQTVQKLISEAPASYAWISMIDAPENLTVYNRAETAGKVLGTISSGGKIIVLETLQGGWYKISYNGRIAYLKPTSPFKISQSTETTTQAATPAAVDNNNADAGTAYDGINSNIDSNVNNDTVNNNDQTTPADAQTEPSVQPGNPEPAGNGTGDSDSGNNGDAGSGNIDSDIPNSGDTGNNDTGSGGDSGNTGSGDTGSGGDNGNGDSGSGDTGSGDTDSEDVTSGDSEPDNRDIDQK